MTMRDRSRLIDWIVDNGRTAYKTYLRFKEDGVQSELTNIEQHLKTCRPDPLESTQPGWVPTYDRTTGDPTIQVHAHITCRCRQVRHHTMTSPHLHHPEDLAPAYKR